jgi:hypothetical protein
MNGIGRRRSPLSFGPGGLEDVDDAESIGLAGGVADSSESTADPRRFAAVVKARCDAAAKRTRLVDKRRRESS